MSRKSDRLRLIDQQPTIQGGGSVIEQDFQDAPPAVGSVNPPRNLTVTGQVTAKSGQQPQKYVNLLWEPPESVQPDYYIIEYDVSSLFTNPSRERAHRLNAALLLDVGKTYYIRVYAVVSSIISEESNTITVTVDPDITIPPDVISPSVVFENGNVVVRWVEPVGEAYKNARIRIYNAARTILYGTYYVIGNEFIWSEAENIRLSGGITSVSVDINAMSWSNVTGTIFTVTATLVKPGIVTSVIANFTTGDLELSWVNPTASQYRTIRIILYKDAGRTQELRRVDIASNKYIYRVEDNFLDTGAGLATATIYYTIIVVSWLGLVSDPVDGSSTKALPINPANVTQTWFADNGTADENLQFTWSGVSYIKDYVLRIDGIDYNTTNLLYTYDYLRNITDHSPSLPKGDPSLAYTIFARDRLNQLSTGVSGTATNIAPDASNIDFSAIDGFSNIGVIIDTLNPIHDFSHFKVVLSGVSLGIVQTDEIIGNVHIFNDLDSDSYKVIVSALDVFGQESAPEESNLIVLDALTIEELRREARHYEDTGTLLDIRVKDGIGYVDTPTNYYEYDNTDWKTITQERPLIDRYGAITIAGNVVTDGDTATDHYFSISTDGSTWTYFTAVNIDVGDHELSQAASEANAQSSSGQLIDFNNTEFNTGIKLTFPSIYNDARFVRWHWRVRNGGSIRISEFYARRLIQTDDLDAEVIRGYHIKANEIVGNHIFGTTLGAIKTSTGTLTVNTGGHIKSGQTAYNSGIGYYIGNDGGTAKISIGNSAGTKMLWDGTNLILEGSGLIVRTASADTRVEITSDGIKGISGGITQVEIRASDGSLRDGQDNVILDSSGLNLRSQTSGSSGSGRNLAYIPDVAKAVKWIDSLNSSVGYIQSQLSGTTSYLYVTADDGGSSYVGKLILNAMNAGQINQIHLDWTGSTSRTSIFSSLVDIGETEGTITHVGKTTLNRKVTILKSGFDTAPMLALGDSDTGFEWLSDGFMQAYANNTVVYTWTDSMITTYRPVSVLPSTAYGTSTAFQLFVIGTTSVAGNFTAVFRNSSSANLMYLENNGVAWVNQNWTVGSSREKKKDIKSLAAAKQKVKSLGKLVKEYKLETDDRLHYGLIAEEVEVEAPELVVTSTLDDTSVKGIIYGNTTPLLLKAYDELDEELKQQSQRITALEAELRRR